MSWINRLENIQFTITCGDGRSFTPLWRNGEKSKDFNITKYDFINTAGSFIDRKQPQSNLYPLVFWFQGDDNIDQCDAFEASANDPRAWVVEHPYYGTLRGQPNSMRRNDLDYNVTEVTVDFWESISGDFPNDQISLEDEVLEKANATYATAAQFFTENANPESEDINTTKENTALVSSKFKPDKDNFNDYLNIVNKAIMTADALLTNTTGSFAATQEVTKAPALFNDSVFTKITSYRGAYEVLKENPDTLFNKYDFEAQGATIIASVCLSCMNPQGDDYITRSNIERANSVLVDLYADYLEQLDLKQVDIYDVDNAWSPTVQIQNGLADIVSFTSKSLFSISFNARQERTIELKKDSNLILLTHQFVGLDLNDENLDIFRKINNIKNNELFKLKIGRTIRFFV